MTDSMKERAAKVVAEAVETIKRSGSPTSAVNALLDVERQIRALPDDAGDVGELVEGLAEIKEMHCDGAIENHDVIDEYRDWSTKAANTITALQTKVDLAEALVEKLDQAIEPINNAIQIATIHHCPYQGPMFGDELNALKAALANAKGEE